MRLTKVTFVSAVENPDGRQGVHTKEFSEPGYEISQDGAVTTVTHKASGGRVVTNIPGFGTPHVNSLKDAIESRERWLRDAELTDGHVPLSASVDEAKALSEPFSDPSDTQTGTPKAKRGRPPKGGV